MRTHILKDSHILGLNILNNKHPTIQSQPWCVVSWVWAELCPRSFPFCGLLACIVVTRSLEVAEAEFGAPKKGSLTITVEIYTKNPIFIFHLLKGW